MPKVLWATRWLVDTSTSQGHKFSYNLHLGYTRAYWKDISKYYNTFLGLDNTMGTPPPRMPKEHCLGPQKDPKSLGPEKP